MDLKKYHVAAAITVFVALPLLLYATGDFPRRSALKESISVVTLVSFFLMLGQFFLARSNKNVIGQYRLSRVLLTHKIIAYTVLAVFLVHPFLIVVPRYFEAGVGPLDALTTVLTTFDSIGVVFGLVAWCLLLILGVTATFRIRIVRMLGIRYTGWRRFHGYLVITFTFFAAWHAIDLGRHTDLLMSALALLIAGTGTALLLKAYLSPQTTQLEQK